ncbi:MAG: hypothetical protein IPQ06_14750 [Chitinophagaceae bacterium]|nr:hypothetical protein [Chitinophagaceae bacterium]
MQILINYKTLLIAGFSLIIFSCNSSAKKDKEPKNNQADTTPASITPPADNPAEVARESTQQKCYSNDGLKYKTVISINFSTDNGITGSVMSQEYGSDKKESTTFTGTVDADKLNIRFTGTPPLLGAASEWTTRPWALDHSSGKEKLRIVFNSKNYATNKWAETEYEFDLAGCK